MPQIGETIETPLTFFDFINHVRAGKDGHLVQVALDLRVHDYTSEPY